VKFTLASILIAISLAAAMITACKEQGEGKPAAAKPDATAPAPATARHDASAPSHGAQRQQLRELMKRISAETQEHWPGNIPPEWDDVRATELVLAFDQAARLAEELAEAADGIPDSVRGLEMTETDRADFQAEAGRLRNSAIALRAVARYRQPKKMQERLDAIGGTCIACHIRFRDYAGELDVQRVLTDKPGDAAALARVWPR
jgi:cytochrome c556